MLLLRKKLRNDWSRPAASARPPSPAGRVQTGPSTRPDIPPIPNPDPGLFPHPASPCSYGQTAAAPRGGAAGGGWWTGGRTRRGFAEAPARVDLERGAAAEAAARSSGRGGMAGKSASGTGEEAPPGGAGRGGTGGLRQGRKALVMRGPRPTTSSTSADPGSDKDAVNEVAGGPRTRASSRGGGANSPMRAAPGTTPLPPAGKSR